MRSSRRIRKVCFLLRRLLADPAVAAFSWSTFLAAGHTHGMDSVGGCLVPYRAPPWSFFGPSRKSDVAGDGPSPEGSPGSNQEDDSGGNLRDYTQVGTPSSPIDNPLNAPADTQSQDLGLPQKRSTAPAMDLTPARPRVRTRMSEGAESRSSAGTTTPGGDRAEASRHSSGSSTDSSATARSRRAQARMNTTGPPIKVKRKGGKRPACGLDTCGSATGAEVSQEGVTSQLLLCAACHREKEEGTRWAHLAEETKEGACLFFKACLEGDEEMPSAVVGKFSPSNMCLCRRGDCFFQAAHRHRNAKEVRICVTCGRTGTARWRRGGCNAELYQAFFDGSGKSYTKDGMGLTNEVIDADSWICNACHMGYSDQLRRGYRPPTVMELNTRARVSSTRAQSGNGIRQGKQNIAHNVYSTLVRGELVCNDQVEEWFIEQGVHAGSGGSDPRYRRQAANDMLRGIGEGVVDVTLEEFNGSDLGEDGRKRLLYLIPNASRGIHMVRMYREIRRLQQDNQDLREQIKVARGNSAMGVPADSKTPQST